MEPDMVDAISESIQRQYNEVVASQYDRDPQAVIGRSLDRAIEQLQMNDLLQDEGTALRVLDVGMGTGLFLAKLKALGGERIQPFGLDLAEKMVECARQKLPDLIAEVGDAADLDNHFQDQSFDLICTHFITGFVSMNRLADAIWKRLDEGGYWSLVGGTMAGYPNLQAKAKSPLVQMLCGAAAPKFGDLVCNPTDLEDVARRLEAHGFEICLAETFEPALHFANFDEFMAFAYWGGWLTPIIESIGLHQANAMTRWLLNQFCFPLKDHHNIAVVLARKTGRSPSR
jgi:SAM-dependent methyltransferase